MSNKERIERLEEILATFIKVYQNHNCDYTWQQWNDPLDAFLKELKEEENEKTLCEV